jgi:hypothetical protein
LPGATCTACTRGKTLVAGAAAKAMLDGVGMVSTLMLKDTSDRTAFKVFEPGGTADLPGFGQANNLLLLADPASFGNCPGRRAAAGCNASPGSRTARRWSWTRAACCSARWRGWPRRLRHEVRAGGRVPHLPH